MADTFDAGKFGAVVALNLGVANAVTNKTAEDLAVADASANTSGYVMPQSGSVVGVSVKASTDLTAGTVSFAAHADGTEFAQTGFPNPGLESVTNVNESYASIRPGILTFAAGEAVGVSYTSSTDAAPTDTNDYSVSLFVQLDPN